MGVDYSVLQAFVPELQSLRRNHTTGPTNAGLQAEVRATFGRNCGGAAAGCGLTLLGDGENATSVVLRPDLGLVLVDATSQGNTAVRAGPLPPFELACGGWTVHAIVDHSIVEVIVNNRTALVVYAAPSSATSGQVGLVGPASVKAWSSLDVWTLASASV
jgi:hypothetical protein